MDGRLRQYAFWAADADFLLSYDDIVHKEFDVGLLHVGGAVRNAAAKQQQAGALEYFDSFLLGAVDAALAAQNAVVALESLNLAGVYIGALRNKPIEVAAELGLPPNAAAVFGLVVGHPDPARPADVKPRLPQSAVLFREQYGFAADGLRAVEAYDQHCREFQREQGLPEQDWSTQAGSRVRDREAMHGRHLLRESLHALGFELK